MQEGQGLGKKEQGMSVALQVEKTSKRGGRIIHEKDGSVMPPPGFAMPAPPGPGTNKIYEKKNTALRDFVPAIMH